MLKPDFLFYFCCRDNAYITIGGLLEDLINIWIITMTVLIRCQSTRVQCWRSLPQKTLLHVCKAYITFAWNQTFFFCLVCGCLLEKKEYQVFSGTAVKVHNDAIIVVISSCGVFKDSHVWQNDSFVLITIIYPCCESWRVTIICMMIYVLLLIDLFWC